MNPFRTAAVRPVEDEGQSTFTIPAFSGDKPTCRKCKHHHVIGTTDKYDPKSDTLYRKCDHCGYSWVERSADSGGSTRGE